jgi:cytochrome b
MAEHMSEHRGESERTAANRIYVWDVPTRVFHWLLVASYIGAWITYDDNRYLDIHIYAGSTFLGLLIFRLLWGMIGSHYARFHAFAYDFPSVWAYLRDLATGRAERHLGHNPAGGWAIFAIIALGFAVTLAGLLVMGGEEQHGVFAGLLPFPVAEAAREVHEALAWTLLALTVMHVTGVIVESFIHRENLIAAMITGYKTGIGPSGKPYGTIGAIVVLAVAGYGYYWFKGYLADRPEAPYIPFKGRPLPDDATWRKVCGECHLAYHPTLLPARSWQSLMADQADHFGEDLAIEPERNAEITAFLVHNAAESHLSEPAWRIDTTTPPNLTPLRITDTPYWRKKHEDIPERVWKMPEVKQRGNCAACHLDAEQGTFEDAAMRLPRGAR